MSYSDGTGRVWTMNVARKVRYTLVMEMPHASMIRHCDMHSEESVNSLVVVTIEPCHTRAMSHWGGNTATGTQLVSRQNPTSMCYWNWDAGFFAAIIEMSLQACATCCKIDNFRCVAQLKLKQGIVETFLAARSWSQLQHATNQCVMTLWWGK